MSRRQAQPQQLESSMNVAGPPPGEPTFPCRLCGRKFVRATLAKHEEICKRQAQKKRKTFESGKQRASGSDIPLQSVVAVKKEIERNAGKFQPPKTHWREKHDRFIEAIRAAKGVDTALRTGGPLPPPPRSYVPSDYVKCEHCGRNFAAAAAERHIPFCADKNKRQNPPSRQPQQPRRPLQPPSAAQTNSRRPAEPQKSTGQKSAAQRSSSAPRRPPAERPPAQQPYSRGLSPSRAPPQPQSQQRGIPTSKMAKMTIRR